MRRTSQWRGLRGPHAQEAAGLEHAQQLDLQLERHLGDLVEEQRAAVRALEEARMVAVGTGEAALLVAEDLAFHEVGRDGAAVDREEWVAAPRAHSCSVLAASSLPLPLSPVTSTGDAGGRHALDLLEHLAHRLRAAEAAARSGARGARQLGDVAPRTPAAVRTRDPREHLRAAGAAQSASAGIGGAQSATPAPTSPRRRAVISTISLCVSEALSSSRRKPLPSGSIRSRNTRSGVCNAIWRPCVVQRSPPWRPCTLRRR
jgi:hypothetical protein